MANRPAINRPEIVKKIASDLRITQHQTEKIVLAFEHQIARFLRERQQVRIHGFGRFVIVTRKSRTIKQVNTQIPRLLLENQTILFRINPNFKEVLHGRPPKLLKIETKKPTHKVAINKPTQEPIINKQEVSGMSSERKELINQTIKQRLLGIRGEVAAPVRPEEVPEVRAVAALLKQIRHIGYDSISLTYSDKETIEIFAGKPQSQVSHLPKNIVKRFLEAIDLHDLHIPQVRFLPLALNSEKYDKMFLELHSMPTVTGASIKITIK